MSAARRRTVVSFHAHPDDEALLTGGSLAKAAAHGHRVVIVTATSGGAGLAAGALRDDGRLAQRRRSELEAAAAAMGCATVELLGYDDSGLDGRAAGDTFVAADVDEAASRLASILVRERADVLTSYDRYGGYGHPDHVQVHRVGARAAQLAGTPTVLEATLDRDRLRRAVALMRMARLGRRLDVPPVARLYTPRTDLTHRIDVRRHLPAKRAAMAAHVSQATTDSTDGMGSRDGTVGGDRALAFFLRLPAPVFRLLFGYEWFVQRNRAPRRPLESELFGSLGDDGG